MDSCAETNHLFSFRPEDARPDPTDKATIEILHDLARKSLFIEIGVFFWDGESLKFDQPMMCHFTRNWIRVVRFSHSLSLHELHIDTENPPQCSHVSRSLIFSPETGIRVSVIHPPAVQGSKSSNSCLLWAVSQACGDSVSAARKNSLWGIQDHPRYKPAEPSHHKNVKHTSHPMSKLEQRAVIRLFPLKGLRPQQIGPRAASCEKPQRPCC
jgi:hypothetical protein